MVKPWKLVRSAQVHANRIFCVSSRLSLDPRSGLEHEFFVLESADWVNVIPLLPGDKVVLVRQYRHGRQQMSLEIPGGMMDPTDRDPAGAAGRELLEETGYHAGKLSPIGTIAPNPAIHGNLCHSFVATELAPRGRRRLDGTEDLDMVTVPLAEIPALIRQGQINHALVVVAFYHLGLRGG